MKNLFWENLENKNIRIIKESKVIDNGSVNETPARYEQHFEDGSIIYSNTVPDHFAFKIEEETNES